MREQGVRSGPEQDIRGTMRGEIIHNGRHPLGIWSDPGIRLRQEIDPVDDRPARVGYSVSLLPRAASYPSIKDGIFE